MKGYFIDAGTEVTVYRGGFDICTWMLKDPKSFKRHTTRKDLFVELSDCNVVDDGHGEPVLLANEAGWGITVHLKRPGVESSWDREDRIYS